MMDLDRESLGQGQVRQHKQYQQRDHGDHQNREQKLPLRERKGVNGPINDKRKSEVMIAAQSLDNEVQSVKNLKRISIGSMDMLMDPELEYKVSSSAGKQENRKSWTSGVPVPQNEEMENMHDRAALRYTYPSRAAEGGPDGSFESELSEISFDVTNSEYLEAAGPDDSSSLQESEGDTTDLRGSQKSETSSSGRSISGVGTLKRGASNLPLRKTSTGSDASTGSNTSLTKNLLWVPANQHPNVKPENYLELVQDTLHNIKLEGNEDGEMISSESAAAKMAENELNKENEDKAYRPRKDSSLVRRPSRLRKSYTEFDEENDGYQDTTDISKRTSSQDLENISNLTLSSTNSSRAVSLRDITDELTKISNNAGLTDSDAITLARTLSMAGSFTSDESDDIIENSRGGHEDDLDEADTIERREDDTEFASNMFVKKGFVIPARSSLRRSKFNTYRMRSASEENLHNETKLLDSISNDQHIPVRSVSASNADQVPTEPSHSEHEVDSKPLQGPQYDNVGKTPKKEYSGTGSDRTRQQDHLGTPADQYSHDSKSPSQFIGEDGSNLTSPSTISDFQDIYDHYRQSSVDWEKELKKERDLAQQSDNYDKPVTTEIRVEPATSEELPDSADVSNDDTHISKDRSHSSTEASTDISISTRPEHEQFLDSVALEQNQSYQKSVDSSVVDETASKESNPGTLPLESHENSSSGGANGNRQAQKRGGWAFFSMGAKDILSGDQRIVKDGDIHEKEEFQPEDYPMQESSDFIKTSSHMRSELDRMAIERSNHSKNRHSPIFTENSKKKIMEEPDTGSMSESKAESSVEEIHTDTDEPIEANADSSNSDSSNSFSAQKLEKKFVNLFKRKGKNKSSTNKTGKTHKKLELTKKATNNTLPKFRRAVKGQTKQTETPENDKNEDVSSGGTSPDVELGEPVDDTVMDTSGGSFHDASEYREEEPLSLQPAVSVHSTKSGPSVTDPPKESQGIDSQDVSTGKVVTAKTEIQNESVRTKKHHSHEARQQQQQQQQQQQTRSVQQANPPPPAKSTPQPLPPRKLTFSDVKRLDRPNAPMQFTDSAFGFPLPMLAVSTVVMFDHRLPINVERAIYRLSHLKLSDPKRELRQQVMLSNFMYAYLNLVNHTLYMEQAAQENSQETHAASSTNTSNTSATKTARVSSGTYTADQNDANGAICIPDIQG